MFGDHRVSKAIEQQTFLPPNHIKYKDTPVYQQGSKNPIRTARSIIWDQKHVKGAYDELYTYIGCHKDEGRRAFVGPMYRPVTTTNTGLYRTSALPWLVMSVGYYGIVEFSSGYPIIEIVLQDK